jgi:hypothetical protein
MQLHGNILELTAAIEVGMAQTTGYRMDSWGSISVKDSSSSLYSTTFRPVPTWGKLSLLFNLYKG